MLFLVGCMGARLSLVWLVSKGILTTYIAIVAAMISLGFTVIYLFDLRKVGAETFGKPIWWNTLRPVHALLYGSAAYLMFMGNNERAWKFLLFDTVVGLLFFIRHHALA